MTTNDQAAALKPCPFCQQQNAHVADTGSCWVVCDSCGCEGPLGATAEIAIGHWNSRATPADPALDPATVEAPMRKVVLEQIKRARKAGESEEMLARWICEALNESTALNEAVRALRIFREFVLQNATQWQMGAGVHHHPVWGLVAAALGTENSRPVNGGPEWSFIQPQNREVLSDG